MTVLSLADAKQFLGETGSDRDTEISGFIDAIIPSIERYIGGPAEARSVTETVRPVDEWRALPLTYRPFVSVESITINGTSVSLTDVYCTPGRVLRRQFGIPFWPFFNISDVAVVTYVAGLDSSALPALSLAARIILQHLWDTQRRSASSGRRSASSDMQSTYKLGGYAFAIPNRALEVLDPYAPETGVA